MHTDSLQVDKNDIMLMILKVPSTLIAEAASIRYWDTGINEKEKKLTLTTSHGANYHCKCSSVIKISKPEIGSRLT